MKLFVQYSSWISIVAILWLRMTGVLPNDLFIWFAFLFFCLIGLAAWGTGYRR